MSSTELNRKERWPYPLADWLPGPFGPFRSADYAAVCTWEKRPPKKGEWYLSGAIVAAYRAPADLSTPFYIAKIHRVYRRNVTTIGEEVTLPS